MDCTPCLACEKRESCWVYEQVIVARLLCRNCDLQHTPLCNHHEFEEEEK
jgi:hypothetical protein